MCNLNQQQISWLKENYSTFGYKNCAEILTCSSRSIQRLAGKLKITRKTNRTHNKLTQKQIKFIENNFKRLGPRECAKIIGITEGHVSKIARKLKLWMDKKYDYSELIENFTNPTKPEAAYILGLLWADGCVSKYCLVINNVKQDTDGIEHVFDGLGQWAKTEFQSKQNNKWKTQQHFKCYSKKLCQLLTSYDYHIKSGASPDKILEKIPENLRHYWWRGYFDGDGCIWTRNITATYFVQQVSISSVFEQDWNFVDKLMKQLEVTKYKINRIRHSATSSSSQLLFTKREDVLKFARFIYPNLDFDNIGFKRKFLKFQQVYDYFISRTLINLRKTPQAA